MLSKAAQAALERTRAAREELKAIGKTGLRDLARAIVLDELRENGGNISKTARRLNMQRSSVQRLKKRTSGRS